MTRSKRKHKALKALNYDLFDPPVVTPPAPATLYTRIQQASRDQARPVVSSVDLSFSPTALPDERELLRRFSVFNWMYFQGRLPLPRITYSRRMMAAGSYSPTDRIIKIGRKYHELFPEDINDTLKHEMIHMLHLRHDAAFKREAGRIGASLRARPHPALQKPPRYVYVCPGCGRRYPRQKRLRMASCGVCSPGGKYDERFKLKLLRSVSKRKS